MIWQSMGSGYEPMGGNRSSLVREDHAQTISNKLERDRDSI
jgi:hypothetical protein